MHASLLFSGQFRERIFSTWKLPNDAQTRLRFPDAQCGRRYWMPNATLALIAEALALLRERSA